MTWDIINRDGDRDAIERIYVLDVTATGDLEERSLYYINDLGGGIGWTRSDEYVDPERHGLLGGVHSLTPWDDDWWVSFPDMPAHIAERAVEMQENMLP